MSVLGELRRRNVIRVGLLYGLASWLILQVADVLVPALALPDWALRFVSLLLLLGFPLVLIFAWAYELTPEGLKKQHEVDRTQSITHETGRKLDYVIGGLAVLAIVVVGLDRFVPRPLQEGRSTINVGNDATAPTTTAASSSTLATAPDKSIAVLPFVNMSSDADNEYFSDGISEELLNLLARLPELRVIGRTSSFQFKGRNEDLRSIGVTLGVANLLEGSVRKSGNKVRITAQLIRAEDGSHLWSETYDRTLEDIFAVQDDIARQVVDALEVSLLGDGSLSVQKQDAEAHNLFLQGRFFAQRQSPVDAERAIAYLKRSLDRDPSYALAWLELANVYVTQGDYGWNPSAERYSLASEAIQKALALNPKLASAHSTQAWIQCGNWDWAAADESNRIALELEPRNPEVLLRAGYLAVSIGRSEEGLALIRRSLDLDPLRVDGLDYLGYALTSVGRYSEAEAAFRKGVELSPGRGGGHFAIALPQLLQGKADEALREIELETTDSWRLFGLGLAYHTLGRDADSDAALELLKKEYADEMAFRIAEIHAWRGENDLAFAWLDRAYSQRDVILTDIKVSRFMQHLAADPRYRVMLRKINLPE
jgi:TolB-like protein/Tfp pilus assembly protein PilF